MANRQPEGKIVDKIVAWVNNHDGLAVKVHGNEFQRKGDPDLRGSVRWAGLRDDGTPILMYVHFQVEVKLPGEEPSALQHYRIEEWRRQNYAAGWVTSLDEFKELIKAYVNERKWTRYGVPERLGG